jgi:hypothetical protein
MLCTPLPLLTVFLWLAAALQPAAGFDPERPADLQPQTPVSRLHLFNFQNYGHNNVFALSPDGTTLASANGNYVTLYDLTKTQAMTQPHNIMLDGIYLHDGTIAFSPDGKLLLVLPAQHQEDQSVHFIDAGSGKEVRQIDNDEPFNSLALSADAKMLALGGQQGRVEIWDARSGDEIRVLPGAANGICHDLVFSADGRMLATAGQQINQQQQPGVPAAADPVIQVVEIATGNTRREFRPHVESPGPNQFYYRRGGQLQISALALSTDGRLLAAGCIDQTIRLWDLQTGGELPPLVGHQAALAALTFTPDGKRLASFDAAGLKLGWSVSRMERSPAARLPTLSDAEFAELWTDLGDGDAFQTYRAMRYLTAEPQRALALLRRQLKPVPPADAKHLAQLKADLQSPNGGVRRKAMAGLRQEGEAALGTLSEGGNRMPQPMQARAQQALVRKLEMKYATPERTRALRAVHILEQIGTDGARQLLEELAKGAPGVKLTVAARSSLDALAARADGRKDVAAGLLDLEQIRKNGLSAGQRDALWADLASPDAGKAFRAMGMLRAMPEQAVALLRERVGPEPTASGERIPRLIADLDNNRFPVREKATRDLEKLGPAAETALRQALRGRPAPEARRRLDQLLAKRDQAVLPADTVRRLRAVEVLEQLGSPEARQVLETLTQGPPQSLVTREAKASVARLSRRAEAP